MFFSPASARSFSVRALYAILYGALILGGTTMVIPLLIMVAGSLEPRAHMESGTLVPKYLFDDQALWERYLETKYHGVVDNLRMAWSEPSATFAGSKPGIAELGGEAVGVWKLFLAEEKLPPELSALGFLRPNSRMPAFNGMLFQDWLLNKYGSLESLNRALGTSFQSATRILPPVIRIDGVALSMTPLVREFVAFSSAQPADRKFAWDAGGYYRACVLPRVIGPDIKDYNTRFGTSYRSYGEVPFPAAAPSEGGEPWFFFVSRLLRPDFIQITPSGLKRMEELALNKEDFIRTRAEPADLLVTSIDTLYAQWAAERNLPSARIPQKVLDLQAFEEEKSFWRFQFLTLNFSYVLEEISGRGGAIRNTVILVVLSIGGSLLVNPLAAYALSRYKPRLSYHILLFCLVTMAFPTEVTMIPVFLQLKEFNLLNTFGALILPTLANGFSIFLLKGFFDSLPRELYEAAEIDGASEWTTFWMITMNLSKPILAVIALETFVSAYGTFFYALILAPDPKMWTIMVYIYQLRQAVETPVVYASLIITAIPTMLVFVTCQNIILKGLVVPSEK